MYSYEDRIRAVELYIKLGIRRSSSCNCVATFVQAHLGIRIATGFCYLAAILDACSRKGRGLRDLPSH